MNSRSHVPGVSLQASVPAPNASYLLSHDLANRLERRSPAWWVGLTVTVQGGEDGIECREVIGADGRSWRILLADWNTPEAVQLQVDATAALMLGADLAEVPTYLAEGDRLALVYPARTAQPLADRPRKQPEVGAFLDLARAATATLMEVHDAGIIHGRLSPRRLLVDRDGGVRLTGFAGLPGHASGISTELPLSGPDMPYAAPELLRADPSSVDARTDLYALGVMLYEHLVGALPITAHDLPGWLHAHVAMEAPSARLARPDLPTVIDQILLKLISKDPKQRYQTARALHADFVRVAQSIASTGTAVSFVLARGELAEPSRLSAHLFGRHDEITALNEVYAAFRGDASRRMVLISGEPGAGKSTLVDAFLAGLEGTGAVCTSGKGVQLRQGTPFAPVAQALRTALAHLMAGGEEALEGARSRLAATVGAARALAELVPEAAILPSETHALGDAPAHVAQARSARVIAQTLGALASADAPLVLFLDDLQWFDHASLNVVRQMCADAPAHVFLIGSYRTEAQNRKSVRDLLEAARRSPAFSRELRVQPLREVDTAALVACILKSAPEEVGAISARVQRETQGNPFYIGQLLRRMQEEHILRFDPEAQGWRLSEDGGGTAHEMADLMLDRIAALPVLQRRFLQRCATLGGRCSASFATQLAGVGTDEMTRAVNGLVAAGLLHRSGPDFAIAHDRVLEAAYASMSPAERALKHLGNARLLAERHPDPEAGAAFDIASQIEHCDLADLTPQERPHFARILLLAARKSRSAGEAERALTFVELIRRMLPPVQPDALTELGFDAEWLQCDCLLALGRVDEALAALDTLSQSRADPFSIADVCRLRAIALTVKGAYGQAIEAALEGLAALGMELVATIGREDLEAAYEACRARLDALGLAQVIALPEMTDRRARAAVALLSTLISSFFVKSELRLLHVIRILELTLAHGAAPESAYGLAWFGVLGAHYFGAYASGAEAAQAACTLAQREGYEAQRTAALIALDQVSAWTLPMRTALSHAREGARVGQAAGDLGMVCYARNHIASDMLVIGTRLDRVHAELVDSIALTREIGYGDIELILAAQIGLVDALVSGDGAPPPPDAELLKSSVATQYWVKHYAGLQSFFLGQTEDAIARLEAAEAMAWAAPAHIDTANTCFFLALAHASRRDTPPAAQCVQLADARERFRGWAALNPETFTAKHLLLEAEAARLTNQRAEAMDLYERAADAAAAGLFVHDQALAQELAARFYADMQLNSPAQGCLQSAIEAYREWGAQGKAAHLARHLTASGAAGGRTAAPKRMQHELDLTVMTAASQTLAEEVGLEQVVRTLMKSMLIHAGAQFGLLLLVRNGQPVSEAVARVAGQTIHIELQPAAAPEDLMPASVLKTVLRTRRPVTLADAAIEATQRGLSMDGRNIRSLACIPLIKRGELIGMLYLENALSADVFTPQRMAMLEVLAPQAAISLDAARLYGDLMDENLRRAQAEFDLREARSELARANQLTAMGSFATSVAHEINQPLASLVAQAEAGLRWLNRPQPDLGEVSRSLESIRKAGRRAADIITALRSLVKQAPSPLSRVAVEDVLDEVLKILAPDLETQAIVPILGSRSVRHMILANNIQLQQVFYNLITNALQAMAHRDAPDRRLRIHISATQDSVEVAIEDTGCGMPEEVVARIFQPFYTTKTTGMGVGLAICRSIMDLHGGALDARSVEGQGSTFLVRLPLATP